MVVNPGDVERAAAERVAEVMSPQAALLDLPEDRARAVAAVRRPGRPAGSTSRRTEREAQAVIERFGDARLNQVAVATMPLAELVAMGLSLRDALDVQRLAFAAVAPFLFKRMPVEVDVTKRQVVHLTIVEGDAEADAAVSAEIVGIVEDQGVSDDA